jgi:uncharacterized protein (DUF2147 family)
MKRKISICALLLAVSISAASAATATPGTGLGSPPSNIGPAKKHERTRRPSLIQVIEYKVMSMVAVAKGAIANAEARKAGAKAAMAAKAKAAMAAKAKAAMEAKAKATTEAKAKAAIAKCPDYSNNARPASATEGLSSLDGKRCP